MKYMNASSAGNSPIPDITPLLADDDQSHRPAEPLSRPANRRQSIRSKLLVWRYGSSGSRLPKPSLSWLSGLFAILKKYWWITLIVVALIVAGLAWWAVNYKQQQDWLQLTDYYRRADYQKAAPILLQLPMPNDPDKLRIYGQTMQATNHPDRALEAYQLLYQKDKDPFAKLIIGNIHNQQQDYPQAIKAYQEIIDSNPTYIQAYVNLATVYRLQSKNSDAIAITQKALQNNPNSVILAELAVSLTADDQQSDQHKQAIERLKKLNPQDPLLKDLSAK